MGQALTPARSAEMMNKAFALLSSIDATDVVTAAPPPAPAPPAPNPEDPTPAELQNVSDMLDAANGTLGIIGSIITDTTTSAQEKVDLIAQTLGAAS